MSKLHRGIFNFQLSIIKDQLLKQEPTAKLHAKDEQVSKYGTQFGNCCDVPGKPV